MSDWNGPGLYRIEAGSKRSCRVSLAGGNKADGTKILCWSVCHTPDPVVHVLTLIAGSTM